MASLANEMVYPSPLIIARSCFILMFGTLQILIAFEVAMAGTSLDVLVLATSGALSSVYDIYNPPITIKILFFVIGFNFENKKNDNNLSSGNSYTNTSNPFTIAFSENISFDIHQLQTIDSVL